MINAQEAKQKYIEAKIEQEKKLAEAKIRGELIRQGKLIPLSSASQEYVEYYITQHINSGIAEFRDELNMDIINNLKSLGYKVYLCKKICDYAGWTMNHNGTYRRTFENYPTYITSVVWDDSCFHKDFYNEIKEY